MVVEKITAAERFNELLASNATFFVDFYADWCGPCRVISPKFEELAANYPQAQFFKVNVDELPDLAQQCGIRAMPTFQAYSKGEQVEQLVGGQAGVLTDFISKHASKGA